MEAPSNNGLCLPGFSSHVQAQLLRASQQVNLARQSQTPDAQGNHSHPSSHNEQPSSLNPNPSQGRGCGRGQGRGQWRRHSRVQSQTVSRQALESCISATPQLSDFQNLPPLGSAAPQARNQHVSSSPIPASSVPPAQAQIQTTPAQTFQRHAYMNTPQDFFQRARAGAYRGQHAPMRRQQNQHQPRNQEAPQPSGPNPDFNNNSRPRPRNQKLHEPPWIPDQQYVQDRVAVQHDFLMSTASVALQTALTPEEGQEKEFFRLELEKVAQAAVSGYAKSNLTPIDPRKVKLKCYGSLASGFALEGSDLDLLLMFPRDKRTWESFESDCQRLLEKAFLDKGYGARLLTRTRVPILRVCQEPTRELLENLRENRRRWEEEEKRKEEEVANEKQHNVKRLDADRLPEVTDEQLLAASKAFAELEISPKDIPLPPSPVREHVNLEYKGNVGIHCDINFSNYVAIHNTTLLRCYCKCDPRVREMGLFVKAWAKIRKINTPYYGTLSSYGYILMVLHYLMNVAKPPVIPNLQHMARDADAWAGKTEIELFEGFDIRFDNNEQKIEHAARAGQITENKQSLGALLREFFWYYSDRQGFRWLDQVISIRTVGGILTKQSKGWTQAKWAGEKNQIRLRYLFAIEDPFEIEHNIARTVGHAGVVAIRDEFRRAWEIIGKVSLTGEGEWEWRKADGTIGDHLLEEAEDRGDLLLKDQEFHRKKQQGLRAALAAKEAKEAKEAAKTEGVAANCQEVRSEWIPQSGMSSTSVPNPTQANEGGLSTNRSNSELIRNSKTQLTWKRTKGRTRKVRSDNGSSAEEFDQTLPQSSLESAGTSSKSTAPTTNVQECGTEIQRSNKSEEATSQIANSGSPYVHPRSLNAHLSLRLQDVSVRPGPLDDGKPLAWNTHTHAGRWLRWRDQKIRRGEFGPQEQFAGFPNRLNRLFPFNSARPFFGPSRRAQSWHNGSRKRGMAGDIVRPRAIADSMGNDTNENPPTTNGHSVAGVETPQKDSAISGITAPNPGKAIQPKFKSGKLTRTNDSQKQPFGSGGEARTVTVDKTSSAATGEASPVPSKDGIDITLRPRDQDPNIMPVPPSTGFRFDPRQLRDIAIIKQGGNGCARGGEEWNVNIEGEWGGGWIMGTVKTSSGLVTHT